MRMGLQRSLTALLLLLLPAAGFAFPGDTLQRAKGDALPVELRKKKEPQNYIRPELYFSRYSTGVRETTPLKGTPVLLDKMLGDYGFQHYNFGFYAPLLTRSWYRKDSVSLANFHLLATVNANSAQPIFSGIENQHKLYKFGVGLRMIYNTGKQSILFLDMSPYSVGDKFDKTTTRQGRYASIFAWSWTAKSKDFALRLGVTRTYIFGNRYVLPMLGFRFGELDKCYLSIQLPRSITAAWVVNKNLTLSMYTKPFGGLYRFSNKDSIYLGNDKVLQFGRWELTSGFRADVNLGHDFSFFAAGGVSGNNRVMLSAPSFGNNNSSLSTLAPFYRAKVANAPFLDIGLSVRFGRSKKIAGNSNIYEVIDMNGSFDPGDNNAGPGNTQIPAKAAKREMEQVKYKDVSDLFNMSDLY